MADDAPDRPGYERLDDRRSLGFDRREFLGFIGATLAATACGDLPGGSGPRSNFPAVEADPDVPATPPPPAPELPGDPFQLGVGSGDPLSDGFVLWTRLAPEPLDGGGVPDEPVPVVWEVARDSEFDDLAGRGWMYARPELAHSIHVDVRGLEADRWYWYRFRVGDRWQSGPGRARTMPRPTTSPDRFRMATASCQDYTSGYYTAHHHLAREEIDLVAFLGDYIYEYAYGSEDSIRRHAGPTLETLDQFRQRYALYKSDPDLQASHANCPWVFTWDDHEVSNNYAGMEPNKSGIEDFKAMRAAAYQAYFEHMPLRIPLPDDPSSMKIYRSAQFGDLVRLYVLDGRQYRSGIICNGEVEPPCDEATSANETMLGEAQHGWLVDELRKSETVWNAICQQTVFAPVNFDNAIINPDMWDGYQAERQALLDRFASEEVENVTVLTGDIHSAGFAELRADDDRPAESEKVGHEIVATSISSGNSVLGGTSDLTDLLEGQLPYVHYFDPSRRGYCLLEYRRDRCRVWFRAVESVRTREAEIETDRAFEIRADSGEVRELST